MIDDPIIERVYDALDGLSGLIPREVGVALHALAMLVPADLAIVELGSFKGKSTCFLASGAVHGNGAHVYAFDAWDLPDNETGRFGFAEPGVRNTFDAQVARMGLSEQVTATRAHSADAGRTWLGPPVGLLYVDGDHTAKGVRRDVDAWLGHLAPGGLIAFDDYGTPRNPGVALVVDEMVANGAFFDFNVTAGRLAVGVLPNG